MVSESHLSRAELEPKLGIHQARARARAIARVKVKVKVEAEAEAKAKSEAKAEAKCVSLPASLWLCNSSLRSFEPSSLRASKRFECSKPQALETCKWLCDLQPTCLMHFYYDELVATILV